MESCFVDVWGGDGKLHTYCYKVDDSIKYLPKKVINGIHSRQLERILYHVNNVIID